MPVLHLHWSDLQRSEANDGDSGHIIICILLRLVRANCSSGKPFAIDFHSHWGHYYIKSRQASYLHGNHELSIYPGISDQHLDSVLSLPATTILSISFLPRVPFSDNEIESEGCEELQSITFFRQCQ